MKLRNFYIFFPIVLTVFFLFVIRYKFQNLFVSKYIISQKQKREFIEKYVSKTTQNFILEITNSFLPFKNYLKYIIEDFKNLENSFTKSSYKAFHYSKNQTQIYGLLTDKTFYGIFEEGDNKIFFSFVLNKTRSKPRFFIYYLKINNSSLLNYESNYKNNKIEFLIIKDKNKYLLKEENKTMCYLFNKTLENISCDNLDNLLLNYENLYQKIKYNFLKIFEGKKK